ncbi:MAG: hypothetical protein HWD61_05430 [Parachlamydiaceae bacterium]|nr:MAG: hypothetical protein HWD61_05430 [Parachlamydiaceae bacterium]
MTDISNIKSSSDPLYMWNGSSINSNNLDTLFQESALAGINDEDPIDTLTTTSPTSNTDSTGSSDNWKKLDEHQLA